MSVYPPPVNDPSVFNPVDWPTGSGSDSLSNYVTLTTAQNISGFKTFSTAPQMASFLNGTGLSITSPATAGTLALTSDIPSLTNYVDLSSSQTITGAKTFSAAPQMASFLNGTGLSITSPATAGTLALTSEIPSLSGYVDLSSAQTISGAKTFDPSKLQIVDTVNGGTASFDFEGSDSGIVRFPGIAGGGTQYVLTNLGTISVFNKDLTALTNTFPRNYYIAYGNSGSQNISSSSSFTTTTNALWNGTTSNQSSGTISWTGASGTFTVNSDGLYFVSASCNFNGSTAAGQRAISISCSDGQVSTSSTADNSSPAFSVGLTITTLFFLSASTTINCSVRQLTGSTLAITTTASGGNKFMVYRCL